MVRRTLSESSLIRKDLQGLVDIDNIRNANVSLTDISKEIFSPKTKEFWKSVFYRERIKRTKSVESVESVGSVESLDSSLFEKNSHIS